VSDLAGFRFVVPAVAVAVHDSERLAVGFLTGAAVRFGQGVLEHSLDVGCVDLALVRAGRCPLLEEHFLTLDHLLGRVLAAEVEGPLLRLLVEFGPGERADRVLRLLRGGWPLSLSAGTTVRHAEHVAGDLHRATSWRLSEVSVVPVGKDEAAFVRALEDGDDVARMVARMAPPAGDAGRLAARRALRLDEWQSWARAAGAALEVELGLDAGRVCDLLEERVRCRCGELERDFRP
jgi:hypothetical protein